MKNNTVSIRLGNEIRDFLFNMNNNRIFKKKQEGKIIIKGDTLSANNNLKLIVKYFKNNNNKYLELINMEYKNDWCLR